jgi:hypothetical protein
MIDTWVTVLILVSSFNEGPEVTQLSGFSEIAINGWVAVILGVNRKLVVLAVSFSKRQNVQRILYFRQKFYEIIKTSFHHSVV